MNAEQAFDSYRSRYFAITGKQFEPWVNVPRETRAAFAQIAEDENMRQAAQVNGIQENVNRITAIANKNYDVAEHWKRQSESLGSVLPELSKARTELDKARRRIGQLEANIRQLEAELAELKDRSLALLKRPQSFIPGAHQPRAVHFARLSDEQIFRTQGELGTEAYLMTETSEQSHSIRQLMESAPTFDMEKLPGRKRKCRRS